MQSIGTHDLALDQIAQRTQRGNPLTATVDQGRARDIRAETHEDLSLPIEREVIIELRDQDMRQEARAEHPAPDRPRGSGWLNDILAGPAGFLDTGGLNDLQLGGDEVEDLGHILADQAQDAAALGATITWIEHDTFARRVIGDPGLAAPSSRRGECRLRRNFSVIPPYRCAGRRHGHFEILEGQLKLFDLAFDLLRARSELLSLQPCNADLESLDQDLVGACRCR